MSTDPVVGAVEEGPAIVGHTQFKTQYAIAQHAKWASSQASVSLPVSSSTVAASANLQRSPSPENANDFALKF